MDLEARGWILVKADDEAFHFGVTELDAHTTADRNVLGQLINKRAGEREADGDIGVGGHGLARRWRIRAGIPSSVRRGGRDQRNIALAFFGGRRGGCAS